MPAPAFDAEIETFRGFCRDNPGLFDLDWMRSTLSRRGHTVHVAPDGPEVSQLAVNALRAGKPFSVIRIGDGEANLLVYGRESSPTPDIDAFAARSIVDHQQDRGPTAHEDLIRLRDEMRRAVVAADVIGVLGLWRPAGASPPDVFIEQVIDTLPNDVRGIGGQVLGRWIATRLPDLVGSEVVFSSAHLYAGVVNNIAALIGAAKAVVCITDRSASVDYLRSRFEDRDISHIVVGSSDSPGMGYDFIDRMAEKIASRARGTLFLIGAGPWAEIYCRLAKEAGSVGLDIGSAFDLLSGLRTRPIHDKIMTEGKISF